jgi:hypothetical protein
MIRVYTGPALNCSKLDKYLITEGYVLILLVLYWKRNFFFEST